MFPHEDPVDWILPGKIQDNKEHVQRVRLLIPRVRRGSTARVNSGSPPEPFLVCAAFVASLPGKGGRPF